MGQDRVSSIMPSYKSMDPVGWQASPLHPDSRESPNRRPPGATVSLFEDASGQTHSDPHRSRSLSPYPRLLWSDRSRPGRHQTKASPLLKSSLRLEVVRSRPFLTTAEGLRFLRRCARQKTARFQEAPPPL